MLCDHAQVLGPLALGQQIRDALLERPVFQHRGEQLADRAELLTAVRLAVLAAVTQGLDLLEVLRDDPVDHGNGVRMRFRAAR